MIIYYNAIKETTQVYAIRTDPGEKNGMQFRHSNVQLFNYCLFYQMCLMTKYVLIRIYILIQYNAIIRGSDNNYVIRFFNEIRQMYLFSVFL